MPVARHITRCTIPALLNCVSSILCIACILYLNFTYVQEADEVFADQLPLRDYFHYLSTIL